MKSNRLGNTDLTVSAICLGTMTFGVPVAETDAIRLVHWALDHGVNFFDTADIYEGYNRFLGSPGGVGETILGKALQDRRASAVVTTKVGNPVGGDYEGTGLSRRHITHQVEASLRRLQTDCIDIYELHKADPETPLAESLEVMAELIRTGKVRHFGFSNFEPEQIAEVASLCAARGWPAPAVAQPLYNWLERKCEDGYLPLCRANNIAVTPYQPLQGGLLAGKYQPDQPPPPGSRGAEHPRWLKLEDGVHQRLDVFLREAREAGMPPARYAIHWLLQKPEVSAVVVGAKNEAQLEDLMGGTQ